MRRHRGTAIAVLVLAVVAVTLAAPSPASSYWQATTTRTASLGAATLATPTGLACQPVTLPIANNIARISWTAVPNAASYIVVVRNADGSDPRTARRDHVRMTVVTDVRDATTYRRWGRVWAWTSTALLSLVVVAALLITGLPFALGAQTYTVLTGSMRPSIEPGALIAVRATDTSDIRIGDVVTYQRESGRPDVVTHRVVGVSLDGSGDVVFTTLPWLGYPHLFVSGGAARAGIVAVVGIAVIAYGIAVIAIDVLRRRRPREAPPARVVSAAPELRGSRRSLR